MDILTNAVSALGLLLSGGGIAALIGAIAKWRQSKATVAETLNESTLEWASALKADAAELRREAQDARQETEKFRRDISQARRELDELSFHLRRLVSLIHDPYMTLERLRAMVPNQETLGAVEKMPPGT